MVARTKKRPDSPADVARQKIPDEKRRTVLLRVLVTEKERDEIKVAADKERRTVSTWIQLTIQKALRKR